jgi:hypothetical protein
MKRTVFLARWVVLFLAIAAPFVAWGQFSTGITGLVTDATGAVIPKAIVTAHNELTNVDINTATTSSGDFTFTSLKPGLYDISATAPGFETARETGIHLQLEATLTVKLTLKPGAVTESVSVRAEEAQIDQTHADRGVTYSTEELEESPFDSGNPLMLANAEPGVYFNGCTSCEWVRPFDNNSINLFSANGQGSDTNDFQVDGSPNNANTYGGRNIGYVPPTASIQEMKFVSNPYDAQYGHTGGGIFDVVTKYGTNKLHGQVYENARRTWLDANTHYNDNPIINLPKASDTRNQYGFEVDGPVVIPYLFNGRDKTFFEGQFENYSQNTPNSGIDDVPPLSPGSTTQNVTQTGDFSQAYYWNGTAAQQINIYDPLTATGANGIRSQFSGNQIQSGRWNSNAQKLLSYLPLPNVATPVNQSWGIDNYKWQLTETDKFKNVVARLDHNFGASDKAYLRFAWNKRFQNNGDSNGLPGAAETGVFPLIRQNHFFTGDWLHTFNTSSILDLHLSYTRYIDAEKEGLTPFDLSQVGLSSLSVAGTTPVFPAINVSGVTDYGNWASNGGNKISISNTVAFMPIWTYIHGKHTIKAGMDYRWMRASNFTSGASSGSFTVGNGWTKMQALNDSTTENTQGIGLASMLLGSMDSGYININANSYFSYPYIAPFFQDDWKVTQKLTVNLGARWDLQGPPSEANNKMIGDLDTTTPNPVMSEITTALPNGAGLVGGLTFAGVNGQPRTLFAEGLTSIQPRVGFAYSLTKKTVIRGGIGDTFIQFAGQGYNNGFSQSTNYVSSTDGGYLPNGATLSNPIPSIAQPAGASLGLESQLGNNISVSNRNFKTPGVVNYSLGAERQLNAHTTVDLSYVGSTGFHLGSSDNINHVSTGFAAHCNLEMGASITTFNNCNSQGNNPEWVANPFKGVDGFSTANTGNGNGYYTNSLISAGAFTRPLPQFGEIYQSEQNDGETQFNSLQAVITHRWSNALTAHGSFVWAKTMDSGTIIDELYRIRGHYVDFGNRKWRWTANAVWHMPVGKGRTFLGNSNRLVDGAIGGWTMGAIYYYQAGTHSNVGFPYQNPGICGESYCNWVEVVHKQNYGVHRIVRNGTPEIAASSTCVGYYDNNGNLQPESYAVCPKATPAARDDFDFIQRPTWGAYQNVSDSGVYNPRGQQLDMSMTKTFPVWERTKVEVRFEGYNLPNHPSWDGEGYWWAPWDPNFGTINLTYSGQTNLQRNVQLSAKIMW